MKVSKSVKINVKVRCVFNIQILIPFARGRSLQQDIIQSARNLINNIYP